MRKVGAWEKTEGSKAGVGGLLWKEKIRVPEQIGFIRLRA